MAVPRIAPRFGGGGGVALPQPLAPSEAARIRRIFAQQRRGDIPAAVRETAQLHSTLLLGHILADRYLGDGGTESSELADWLSRFRDQSDAPAIRARLLQLLPGATRPPPLLPDELAALPTVSPGTLEGAAEQDGGIRRVAWIERAVGAQLRRGNATAALNVIGRARGVSAAYGAMLRAEVAQSLFTQNDDVRALDIAAAAFRRTPTGQQVGLSAYIAGLSAWRLHRPDLARFYFENAARTPIATPGLRAAGAYWAARAHLRTGDMAGFVPWMQRAAQQTQTFYGMLAQRALGLRPAFSIAQETPGEADVDAIAATPQGQRAFALLQVNEPARASDELRTLWPSAANDPVFAHALLMVARLAGLTDLADQIAAADQCDGDAVDNDPRLAMPKLQPRGGFRVDEALVYALTRLESNFDAAAVSHAGARGLMQIMPVTANYIVRDFSLIGTAKAHLHDPAINLQLGQSYVMYLARQAGVDDDLISILASYNSGPGSFARWSGDVRDMSDPLLFIEAIPNTETRNFVQRALAYSWIYAARLRLPSPSLDALAAGDFPRFTTGENGSKLASSARLH